MMHGRCFSRSFDRMRASTSSPLRFGIMRSSNTRSMSRSFSRMSIASCPSYARVTRNGPCSSFILMIRPMWGSSSATSTWRGCIPTGGRSDKGRHLLAIPPKLEQELADVRLRLHEHEKHCLGREHRHDHEATWVFEDACDERTTLAGGTKLVGSGNDGGHVCREAFRIQIRDRLAVDQEPVTTEDDRRFDTVALPNCGDEFADRRHARSRRKVVRSITRGRGLSSEQSLEVSCVRRYASISLYPARPRQLDEVQ